jgi:hypothetical protein
VTWEQRKYNISGGREIMCSNRCSKLATFAKDVFRRILSRV